MILVMIAVVLFGYAAINSFVPVNFNLIEVPARLAAIGLGFLSGYLYGRMRR